MYLKYYFAPIVNNEYLNGAGTLSSFHLAIPSTPLIVISTGNNNNNK